MTSHDPATLVAWIHAQRASQGLGTAVTDAATLRRLDDVLLHLPYAGGTAS